MAKRTWKGVTVKLDGSQGTLVDISQSVNSIEFSGEQENIEITPLGADERTYMYGLAGATLTMNGWNDSTTNAIFAPLVGNNTTITKTLHYYDSAQWWNGEFFPSEVTLGLEVGQVQTWAVTMQATGSVTNTTT